MKRLLHAAAFSSVIAASGLLTVSGVLADLPGQPYLLGFLDQFAHALAMSLVVVGIIAACEGWPTRGAARALLQATALCLGVTGAAFAIAKIAGSHSLIARIWAGSTDGFVPTFLWFGFAAAAFFSWYYAVRERAARAIDALAEESVLRHAALRRAGEARFKALRAQVDPSSLDAKLAAIDTAYRASGETGDRMLDDLIDYLTEALAASRGASKST